MTCSTLLAQTDWIDTLSSYFQRLQQGRLGLTGVVVELALIGVVVYAALSFLQGTRGARLLKSFGLILIGSFLVVRLLAERLELDRIIFIYPYFVLLVVLTTIVAFQPEIRRGLIRLGETSWFRFWTTGSEQIIDPIVSAVTRMSQEKIGALIAVQRNVGLDALLESGIKLDAEATKELLETIFWPGSALHDMGVVIRRSRVAAAACQFPLAESGSLDMSLGSRHRAALGLSQECDALIVVVSEETGTISLAERGKLDRPLTPAQLRDRLAAGLSSAAATEDTRAEAETKTDSTETAAEKSEPGDARPAVVVGAKAEA